MIYLDNASTTFPKPDIVYDTVDKFSRQSAVNIGRGSYKAARAAGLLAEDVRKGLQSLANARGVSQVVLTPSATVAINQIIRGAGLGEGSVAYLTPYEHNAVARTLYALEKTSKVKVIELPLKSDLSIDIEKTKELFAENHPDFVAVTAVSNVTGYELPYREIFTAAKEYGAFALLDGAQAVGLKDIAFGESRADALVFAGHKTLYAPFGVAGFILNSKVKLAPVITGGNGVDSENLTMPEHGPERYEAGSINSVAVAGLAAALDWIDPEELEEREKELTEILIKGLEENPQVVVYKAPDPERQSGIVSFNVKGFTSGEVAAILDYQADIAVRAGHHCAALIHKYLEDEEFDGVVRVSLGAFTEESHITALLDALAELDGSLKAQIPPDVVRGNC